jgi:hypothetical protein
MPFAYVPTLNRKWLSETKGGPVISRVLGMVIRAPLGRLYLRARSRPLSCSPLNAQLASKYGNQPRPPPLPTRRPRSTEAMLAQSLQNIC